MGFLSNTFALKEKLWEGADTAAFEAIKAELSKADIWCQTFKVNQQSPKCNGDCGTCAKGCDFPEGTPVWEKFGAGFSDDLLKPKGDVETFAIYVKEKDLAKARKLLQK